jgi:hypothetical protein
MRLWQLRWRKPRHDRASEIHNNTLRQPHLHKDRNMAAWMGAAAAEALEMKHRYSLARFYYLVQ